MHAAPLEYLVTALDGTDTFADEAPLRAWHDAEPNDVWRDVTVQRMRLFRPAP